MRPLVSKSENASISVTFRNGVWVSEQVKCHCLELNQFPFNQVKPGRSNTAIHLMLDESFQIKIFPVMAGLILMLILILWLPQMNGKSHNVMCTLADPYNLPFDYYQKGDLIIGTIATMFGCILNGLSFNENPEGRTVLELV